MTAPATSGSGAAEARRDGVVIRRATDDDAARVAEFARRTFVETFAADNTDENMAMHVAKAFGTAIQLGEIRDRNMVTLVADLDSAMAGFAQLRQGSCPVCVAGDSPIELLRFYVDRPLHGRGIAQLLMRAVEHAARELGGRTLWLGVWEHNPRAITFYTKCGLVDVGSHAFMLGAERQTDRVMARSL